MRLGVKCAECGEVIVSQSVHDYRLCKCGATFVDGGRDYLRYGTSSKAGEPEQVEVPDE